MCIVVMLEHCKSKPFDQVILAMVDKDAEVFFDFLIDSFSLFIGLRMENHRGIAFNLKQII